MESAAEKLQLPYRRIDVHHHFFPPAYKAEAARRGITEEAGVRIPGWTVGSSLGVMDANGIETAVLSLSAPGVYFGHKGEAIALARLCNEYGAQLCRGHPFRFGFFAVLPMPFTQAACSEVEFALDVLGADGVVLLGSVEGIFLGDPRYDELMSELNRRRAVVLVHPNLHPSSHALDLVAPDFLLKLPCDTSRAALNLVLRGVTEQYPDIRWILSHGGGFLPYIGWRGSLVNAMPRLQDAMPLGFLTYLRRFYFDTALSTSPISMAALRELVEPDRTLFGSDFPYAPAVATTLQVQTLKQSPVWDQPVRHGIDRVHALRLFPRFSGQDEPLEGGPIHQSETLHTTARRHATRSFAASKEHLRYG